MLAILAANALAVAEPPAPVVINLLPPPCPERSAEADVTVCARRIPDYRIDPGVLAGVRAREALPTDTRTAQAEAVAGSCHDEPSKCQGGSVIPILPAAIKSVEAMVLAARGEDWRQPFRTKPDEYEQYRAAQAKARPKVSVSVGASARAGTERRP
ncbi:hypothetical protein OMW55_00600 [Sphingomonas sp. BN140010]|uniref:Uncharacterized protein n=1 Tax=Sphingomonas arvum TaxID=2992113 RepID=A0ABT3JB69_9SPHN|nr:hypothetical protein [Sphingomonas sp. BN140010]MCW3796310.1 hypothetical protein [Sphingomonas sp. BN140010]